MDGITRKILYGGEYMEMNEKGQIIRKDQRGKITVGPSDSWRVTGAVAYSNFGHVTRTWTLKEIWDDPESIPWKYKNGRQRTFIRDLDHGTQREWRCPNHEVFKGN